MNQRFAGRATTIAAVGLAAMSAAVATTASADPIEVATTEQVTADKSAAAAQDRINGLSDEAQAMLVKYRQALADAESFKKYNDQLAVQVASQATEIANIRRQLDEIEVTARDVLPLMTKMVDTLEKFVALDVPFLLEERTKRVSSLKAMLSRSDVSISEKYRRILEAYQIEMEYGRTLDAYDGKLEGGKEPKNVEFVRLGRITLMYRTLDGKEAGYWDADKKGWVQDNSYAPVVRTALQVAKKQGAPDLMLAPVHAPV
jgi:hypothetical protein